MAELKALVIAGPDPATHHVVRWRCLDLRAEVSRRFEVTVHESTIGKWLHQLGLHACSRVRSIRRRRTMPRRHIKKLHRSGEGGLAGTCHRQAGRNLVQDEARVGQQGSLEYIWAPVGSRPRAVRDNRRDSVYLFGALCPARAVGAAIIMPAVNSEAMSEHLDEIATQVDPAAHAVILCDGAGWHQTGDRLQVPDNISLLPIPPYTPELNPMENVWDSLRGNMLSHQVWESYDDIVQACTTAWNFIANDPKRIRSIAHREWAQVSF